jgi:hypothetical protein
MNFAVSRKPIIIILVTFILCLIERAAQWLSYLSKSSLNQLDTDFLFFQYILKNIANYENSLMLDSAEKISSSFGILVHITSFANNIGIDNGAMLMLFFCIQVVLGLIGVYLIAKGLKLSQEEIIIVYLFFLASYFTQFGRYIGGPGIYNKVVTSCLAMSVGYVIIGFFVKGRLLTSVCISSLLAYFHPTYAIIFLCIILGYFCYNFLVKRTVTFKGVVTPYLISTVILIPFAINIISSMSDVVGVGIEPIWWEFLKAKTSNPFPMQDGFVIVIPTLITYFITFVLLGVLGNHAKFGSFSRAQWVVGMIILMWIIQIYFSEVIPLSFVARLALTRTTPFALFFMETVYAVCVWRHRKEDKTGLWIIFLILPALMNNTRIFPREFVIHLIDLIPGLPQVLGWYWPDFSIYPEVLFLFFCLLIYIHFMKLFTLPAYIDKMILVIRKYLKHIFYRPILKHIFYGLIFLLLCYVVYKTCSENVTAVLLKNPKNIFLLCLILLFTVGYKIRKNILYFVSDFFVKKRYFFISMLIIFALTPRLIDSKSKLLNFDAQKADIENMWNYIEENTEKGEMILVVPFFDTRIYPVMPLRPIFIDWSEAQMVLYNCETIDKVIKRLELIGMDVGRAMSVSGERCAGIKQYLYPMCRRIIFEDFSRDYNDDWRANISEMKNIAPNLSYVLMKKEYLHINDNPVYSVGEIVLIELSNVYR